MSNTISLHFFEPERNHDKVYIVHIGRQDGRFAVTARWGRRGSFLQEQVKIRTPYRLHAEQVAVKLISQKMAKGYWVVQ